MIKILYRCILCPIKSFKLVEKQGDVCEFCKTLPAYKKLSTKKELT